MTFALWDNALPNTRAMFVRLACDGDIRLMRCKLGINVDQRLTVAQVLEMLQ